MPQIGDFLNRLFSAGGTRGLSGDIDLVLPADPDLAFYNECLRRYQATRDLVDDPVALWDSSSEVVRKSGLRFHVLAEGTDGVAGFTDVLFILNPVDWRRIDHEGLERWSARASETIGAHLRDLLVEAGLEVPYPARPVGFRFIEDGSRQMGGQALGLGRGEFVTGLVPNLYVPRTDGGQRVISVYLNLPGAWEGYQEIGHLYDDQVMLTLGSHWLDNFFHAGLLRPALYRLQRQSGGGFVHIISPDFQDQYRITSQALPGGPSVLSIEDFMGEPVAWLVLAVVEADVAARPATPAEPAPPPLPAVAPPSSAAPVPAATPPPAPMRTPPADAAMPLAPPLAASMPGMPLSVVSTRTVVPVEVDDRILTLRERGALLQKVHFARFMEGYDVYLGRGGEVGTAITHPAATIQVRGDRVSFVAHVEELTINGVPCPPEVPIGLAGDARIALEGQALEYRDLAAVDEEGWPYLGEIRRPGGSAHLFFGERYGIGRDRANKVRLPDEPHNENIVWRPEMESGGVIRSLTGDVPKSRFYTDSIMVASRHAEVDISQEPVVVSLARHCYTYVRRGGDWFALSPTQERGGLRNMDLQSGDELYIGNQVFGIGYPPADGPRFIPSDAGSRYAFDLGVDVEPPAQPPVAGRTPVGEDLPAAAGLGERGPAPPAPDMTINPLDSFMGIDAPPAPVLTPAEPPPARRVVLPPVDTTLPPVDTTQPPVDTTLPPVPAVGPPPVEPPALQPPEGVPSEPLVLDAEPTLGASPRGPLAGVLTLDPTGPEVAIVDEADWQQELGRPARLTLVGWVVSGDAVAGNHSNAAIRIPENRSVKGQFFAPVDYFRIFVRGRRARVEVVAGSEARMQLAGKQVLEATEIDRLTLEVVRRDAEGEEDFVIPMQFGIDVVLPDPRARLLEVDADDLMVRALFTLGLPLRTPRKVQLGDLRLTALFDGSDLTLSDYIGTYRRADGSFQPFFVRRGGAGYRTVAEDGAPLALQLGDGLIVGNSVYVFDR